MSEGLGNPKVLDGTREPQSVRMETHGVQEKFKPALLPMPADGTVYMSHARRYKVLITAPNRWSSPDGRKQQSGKLRIAEFEDGRYVNRERDPEVRKMIDDTLQNNVYFGNFGDMKAHFWLAADQMSKVAEKAKESAFKTLAGLPTEEVEAYVAQLKQGKAKDHVVAPIKQ